MYFAIKLGQSGESGGAQPKNEDSSGEQQENEQAAADREEYPRPAAFALRGWGHSDRGSPIE